jgi:hypothetical protein
MSAKKVSQIKEKLEAFGCEEDTVTDLLVELGLVERNGKKELRIEEGDVWEFNWKEDKWIVIVREIVDDKYIVGPAYCVNEQEWYEACDDVEDEFTTEDLADTGANLISREGE